MPRKRRNPKSRRAEIPVKVLAYLKDDFSGPPEFARSVRAAVFFNDIAAWWNVVRDEILEEWAREQPGTRPTAWWKYDSREPRQRLGGTGQPAHDVSAYAEEYEFGLPTIWVQQAGFLAGVAVDPSDPPTFESEAAYLRRLDLLQAGESERLSRADYEPEAIKGESED